MTTLRFEQFAAQVGGAFTLVDDQSTVTMTLAEATPSPHAPHDAHAFSLLFVTTEPRVFDQQTFHLHHPALGDLAIFMVPIGAVQGQVSYQAIFN